MKKGLSIRFKITLWFSLILIIVTVITSGAILYVTNNVYQKTIKDTLIETVDHNLSEIEFYDDLSGIKDIDQYIAYGDGYLNIDDDYLNRTNGITSALYLDTGELLYGENPIIRDTDIIAFEDESVKTIKSGKQTYHIFDRELKGYGLDGLWLRGVVSSEQGKSQLTSIVRLISFIIAPLLVLGAIIIGYYFAKRSLAPIEMITETAEQISKDDDLKKRIILKGSYDELHSLADSFNEMLVRLDGAFESEKQFTSDASHELKTPVSVILAQCEYSLSEGGDTEEYIDALKTIQRQGNKMNIIISDMLTTARLDSNRENMSKAPVNLSEITELICLDMKFIKDKNIELEADIEQDIFIDGNRELLSRMLTNLISNAYSYGRENGHIFVNLKKEEDKILLSVADDGIGISSENHLKIFNRFYQVDPSHNSKGAGLGLTLVKKIAEFHGGSIALDSELGKGSKFTVSF